MKKTTAEVFQDGAISGFIGYAVLSVYFMVVNVAAGRSAWHTLATLGNSFFGSGSPGPLIAYNGVHLVGFVMLGIIAAFLVQEIESHPAFWYVIFFAFIALSIAAYVVLVMVTGVLADIHPATLTIGNAFAAASMGAYLLWRHPGLARIVHDEELEEFQIG